MKKQAVLDALQEFVTVGFLTAGPALGATIAVVWLIGLILGIVALVTR
jgi:hypothetical protein